MNTARSLFALLRPHEWVKNTIVFAPLIFSGNMFDTSKVLAVLAAFLVFCGATSTVYIINDWLDRDSDSRHPVKRLRPLPSGRVQPHAALLLVGVTLAVAQLSVLVARPLWYLVNAYLVTGMAYSLYLKRKVIVDVFTIAVGFVMRVLAGAAAIAVESSEWIILCTFLLATFLGFSKRRHELVQLGPKAKQHRWVLTLYNEEFLDHMNLVSITLTLTCYIFYTISPETVERFGTPHLLYSVLLVMFGLFRYLFIIHKRQQGSPTDALYSDRQIVLIILLWLLYMVWCIYAWPALA